jgi:antitoxin MazE
MGANDLANAKNLDLNVSRWGNSLAVRLPAALARQLGVGEGDSLHMERDLGGVWQVSGRATRGTLSKDQLMARMQSHLQRMPRTQSVVDEMRAQARY